MAWSVCIIHADHVRAFAATQELVQWYGRMGAKLDRDDMLVGKTKTKGMTIDALSLHGTSLDDALSILGMPSHVSVQQVLVEEDRD